MTNLSPEICRKIRDARREAGISQAALSREVGCLQPALSMFEQGDGTKLNDEVVNKLANKFGIDLKAAAVSVPVRPTVQQPSEPHSGYCPNPKCPGHNRYSVDDRLLFRPDRAAQDPVGGKYCAICGEILERHCPTCGAPVHDGAVCSHCGTPYVAV